MDKPRLSVTITSLEDESITKTYSKVNGLKSLNISGVSNELPYYGIISRSGAIEIIDDEGWLKEQSDNNVLPEVKIIVSIDDVPRYEFVADSNIKFLMLDKKVSINLIDSIESLQDRSIAGDWQYKDTTALGILNDMSLFLGIEFSMNTETLNYLNAIKIGRVLVKKNKIWNILTEFLYGAQCVLYKEFGIYTIRRVRE